MHGGQATSTSRWTPVRPSCRRSSAGLIMARSTLSGAIPIFASYVPLHSECPVPGTRLAKFDIDRPDELKGRMRSEAATGASGSREQVEDREGLL